MMVSQEEAMRVARERFGAEFAESIHLERADFGWIARVEEWSAADGRIGHSVLAVGPARDQTRFYPAGPSARVRRAHLAWLDNCSRLAADASGHPSFS